MAAIGAFASTAALASGPVFYTKAEVKSGESIGFTGTITSAKLKTYPSGDEVVCSAGAATGEITGPKRTENNSIVFTGCKGSGHNCNSEGKPEGTITVEGLEGTLGALSSSKPGIELEKSGGGVITHIECAGALEVTVEGKLFGSITGGSGTSVAAGKLPTSVSLTFKEKASSSTVLKGGTFNGEEVKVEKTESTQEYLKFEGETMIYNQLHGLVNKKAEIQAQTATAKLVTSPAGNLGLTT
jgi:hypothetical protein